MWDEIDILWHILAITQPCQITRVKQKEEKIIKRGKHTHTHIPRAKQKKEYKTQLQMTRSFLMI